MGGRRRPYGFFLGLLGFVTSACGARTGLWTVAEDGGEMDVSDAGPGLIVPPTEPPTSCADAGDTLIYVITEEAELWSFDPISTAFAPIGPLRCPTVRNCGTNAVTGATSSATPFSMAVDQNGIAYVVYCDGELFRVSTATASCRATGFEPPVGFSAGFGMGFSEDGTGTGETLYVASSLAGSAQSSVLATIDTTQFNLNVIGPFNPAIDRAELTGSGGGGLFAFFGPSNGTLPSSVARIDKTSAAVIAPTLLPGVAMGSGWAFAFWGGDFYLFTAPGASTVVNRFRPSDGSLSAIAHLGQTVVGAGVSTCAPQQ